MNLCLAQSHTVIKMVKILIVAPNWIGDAVMAEPLISQLKKNNPNSQIDVLATPWVASIMKAIPVVDQIIAADFQHGSLQWKERKALAKQLALSAYTHAHVLPNSFKSALIPWLAKIPHRIGYQGEMRWGLINEALKNPSRSHRRTGRGPDRADRCDTDRSARGDRCRGARHAVAPMGDWSAPERRACWRRWFRGRSA